ncbi:hypothetical protein JZ751_017266 [Albula glossodonta]|uniref:Uncharacterized protein n=1 Tax=Albula glossodonta TaxID=121402 RepID=A0A8T2MX19_9TELE|nr:hypothetical protein JZ751_017266 [Albula glossodonta]
MRIKCGCHLINTRPRPYRSSVDTEGADSRMRAAGPALEISSQKAGGQSAAGREGERSETLPNGPTQRGYPAPATAHVCLAVTYTAVSMGTETNRAGRE